MHCCPMMFHMDMPLFVSSEQEKNRSNSLDKINELTVDVAVLGINVVRLEWVLYLVDNAVTMV